MRSAITFNRGILYAAVPVVIGLLAAIGYGAAAPSDRWSAALSGVLFAAGSLAAGVLAGFLFGVPKRSDEAGAGQNHYLPNTNLEQVSDWLTKLLLGATLAQAGAIRGYASEVFDSMGSAFGERTGSAVVAGSISLYFLILGFLLGWLGAQLYLGRALENAGRLVQVEGFLRDEAGIQRSAGNDLEATRLEAVASALSEPTQAWAREYERLRDSMESSWERASLLEQVLTHGKRYASTSGETLTPDAVRGVFNSGGDGDRVMAIALMDAREDLVDIPLLCEAISAPRSAFEQYQALVVARATVRRGGLDEAEAQEIRSALNAARHGRYPLGSDRRGVADEIERRLG